ncbi:MAG: hypothetical protein BWK78_09610 [Thiotrichaceae bacterium IS1]|nr:MAG: hypothetical protein BWK78_09610 [Thiotrichaceae bacterium IS1]
MVANIANCAIKATKMINCNVVTITPNYNIGGSDFILYHEKYYCASPVFKTVAARHENIKINQKKCVMMLTDWPKSRLYIGERFGHF